MSLVHIDSCGDAYSTSELDERFVVSGSSPIVEVAGGRNGSSGIKCSAATEFFEKIVPALDTYFSGVAVKLPNITTTTDVITFKEDTINHVVIRILANGAIQALRDATVLGTSSVGIVLPGAFSYIEAEAVIDDAAGVVIIRLDGIEVLNLTSQDTQNAGTGVVNRIRYQGSTDIATYDDLYILNAVGSAPQNTFLGNARVDANLPDGDGTTTDIAEVFPTTPTTHFDKVNDLVPDGDTSYVHTSVSAELDLYTFSALVTIDGSVTIFGVQLNTYGRKDNEGGRQVQSVARPVATNFDGSIGTLISVYQYFFNLWDLNPETAAAWTIAEKDAAEFGIRIL